MAHMLFNERYFGRKPAWHGLGLVMDELVTASQAVKLARLDYRVELIPMLLDAIPHIQVPDKVAITRMPTDDDPRHVVLGIASPHYKCLQNEEIFAVLDPLTELWPVETAGALEDGAQAFMCLDAGEHEVTARNGKKDHIVKYFVVNEDKTGGGALRIMFTPVRIVCANTLTLGLNQALVRADLRHSAGVELEYKARMKLLAEMQQVESKALEVFDRMAQETLELTDFHHILDNTYALPKRPRKLELVGILPEFGEDETGVKELSDQLATIEDRYEARNAVILRRRQSVVEHYDRFNDEHPSFAQTAWAAYQAVTDVEDHVTFRGEDVSAYSAVFGERSKTKARAFNVIMDLMN